MSCARSNARRRGATTLEFALVGGAFLTLLFGIFDVGRYLAVTQSLNALVSVAARAAVVGSLADSNGSCATLPSSITATVPLLNTSDLCVTVTTSASGVSPQTASVSAQYQFGFILPAMHALGGTLSDSTTLTY